MHPSGPLSPLFPLLSFQEILCVQIAFVVLVDKLPRRWSGLLKGWGIHCSFEVLIGVVGNKQDDKNMVTREIAGMVKSR